MRRGGDSVSRLIPVVVGICVTLLAATYTAQASHSASQGGWPPPLDLSQSGGSTSRGPDLALAQNGDLHVIWTQPGGVAFTVYHAGSDDQGSNWSYSVPLTPSGNDRVEAAMDVDQDGLAHTVWIEHPGVFQLWYALLSGDSWEEPTMITETNQYVYVVAPDIVVATDTVHVLWSETNSGGVNPHQLDVFYSSSEAGGSWNPATTTVETAVDSLNPRVAADEAGDLHVVWEENTSPPQIYYVSGTVGAEETVWSMPITVSEGLAQTTTTPDIAVGSDEWVHVVFGASVTGQPDVQDIYYASFPITDAGIVSATLIPGSRVKVTGLLPGYASPAVALSGPDEIHVAWNGMMGEDYADRIYYAVSVDAGANWSDPEPASPRDIFSWPDGLPSLAADDKFVHLVWQEMVSATSQINYTRRFPVSLSLPLALKAY